MTTDDKAREPGQDFIRDIVQADLDAGPAQERGDALSAGAERLPAHRPRQVDLPELRHRRRSSAAAATCASTTPTRPRRSRSTSTPSRATCAGSASTGASTCYHASDYFEQLYDWAEHLIKAGKAYVDDQTPDEMRANRGTLTEPGRNSPFRDRSVEENLDLFRRMRAGEFPNGARVLRAKIDMASRQHQPARPGAVPHPARQPSAHRRRRGASIRSTTSRTASRTPSRASRIRSARWSSRTTGRCTTGSSRTCRCRRGRGSTSSRGST